MNVINRYITFAGASFVPHQPVCEYSTAHKRGRKAIKSKMRAKQARKARRKNRRMK